MVGLTSQCWVPPVIQADTLHGVQTHMMKVGVIFPAAGVTEKAHLDFTLWNPKCLQYNWKKLDRGQCSRKKIR